MTESGEWEGPCGCWLVVDAVEVVVRDDGDGERCKEFTLVGRAKERPVRVERGDGSLSGT